MSLFSESEAKEIQGLNDSIRRQGGIDESTGELKLQNLSSAQLKTIENLYQQFTSKYVPMENTFLPFRLALFQ